MEIQEMDGKSLNITEERISRLREIFPEVFTESSIDFKRLCDVLGDNVSFQNEYYELSWAGKSEARKEVQKQTMATLVPDLVNSINFQDAGNIFIEGENLEVLRVLQKSYFGKVKMIYIDPPYNTGNDSFIYPDDYSERRNEYQQRTGITDENGFLNKQELWKKNSRENGQFHSVWLSMMYPRLYLARNLLREDGVIFISIDDNEQANLKLLCNEVFGEENFVGIIANVNNPKGRSDDKFIATAHEYLLIYAKNILATCWYGFEAEENVIIRYSKIDTDGNEYREIDLRKTGDEDLKEDREDMFYYFYYNQETKEIRVSKTQLELKGWEEVIPVREDGRLGRWRWGYDTSKDNLKKLLCRYMPKRKIWGIFELDYLKDRKLLKPVSAWSYKDVNSERGSEQFIDLGFSKEVFPKPKPVGLIARTLKLTAKNNDLILDFFAGSGSTAQAVLELNEQDNGTRKFICVQMPELIEEDKEAYKAGYKTIADISRARISKVVERLHEKRNGSMPLEEKQVLGFRSYTLSPSNFKQWQGDVQGADAILTQLEMFQDSTKPDSHLHNMATELLLKMALPLTATIEEHTTTDGVLYYLPEHGICMCLQGFGNDARAKVLGLKPQKLIALNKLFSTDELLTNTTLELREHEIELTII